MKCETLKVWTTDDGQRFFSQEEAKRYEYRTKIIDIARGKVDYTTSPAEMAGFLLALDFILSEPRIQIAIVG